jgi:hypothetical protein
MKNLHCLFLTFLSLALLLPAHAKLILVSPERSHTVIVTADKPSSSAAIAAEVLTDHLLQISGTRIPVMKESALKDVTIKEGKVIAGAGDTFILVGSSKLSNRLGITTQGMGSGAIKLQTTGNALILLGSDLPSDPDTTLYAVSMFLEEQLGVRYLWPNELGKVIPRRAEITIPELRIDYTPLIRQRQIRNYTAQSPRRDVGLAQLGTTHQDYVQLMRNAEQTQATTPDWYTWQKLGGRTGLVTGHAFGYIWKKYGAEHPEWFAMQPNGSRDQSRSPDRARLCVSNTALQDAIARDKIEELDKNPKQSSVSIDPNDGGGTTFCMCPECKKLDPPEGVPIRLADNTGSERKIFTYVSLTDRMVYFWNSIAQRVVQKHPDALLTVRAYSAYVAPPLHQKLHPNLVVEQVSSGYFNEEATAKRMEEWSQWATAARQLAWRPNFDANYRRHGFPVVLVHKLARDFRARAHAGMISTDVDSVSKSWATNGLNIYVLARLHWNPDLDVDAIVDDYCQAGFGNGGPAVKKYFQHIEDLMDNVQVEANGALNLYSLAQQYDAPNITLLRSYLNQARQAIGNDATQLKRVDFLETGINFAELQSQAFGWVQEIKSNGKAGKQEAIDSLMTKRYSLMKELYQNQPLAIDISYLLWGSEGTFRPLQSSKTKQLLASPPNAKTIIDADENGMPEEQQVAG